MAAVRCRMRSSCCPEGPSAGRSRRLWLGHAKIWEAQSGNLCGEPVGHRVVCAGGPDGLKKCLRPDVLHIRWGDAGCRLTPFLHGAEALLLSRPPARNTSVRARALRAPTHLCCPRARTTACRRLSIEATVQVRASICSSTCMASESADRNASVLLSTSTWASAAFLIWEANAPVTIRHRSRTGQRSFRAFSPSALNSGLSGASFSLMGAAATAAYTRGTAGPSMVGSSSKLPK